MSFFILAPSNLSKKSIDPPPGYSGHEREICQYIENYVTSRARTVQRCAGVVVSCHFWPSWGC